MRRVFFAIIVMLAACLRLAGLAHTGILGVDHGRYVLDGYSKLLEINTERALAAGKWGELRGGAEFRLDEFIPTAAENLAQEHPFSPKLGFAYLTAGVMTQTGLSVSACNYVEAASGILLVAVLILFVGRLWGPGAGLLAGALLAFSAYAIYFSRSAYPQNSAVLLLLLAVWTHLRWSECNACSGAPMVSDGSIRGQRCLFLTGALAGLSFWVNYQAAGALPMLPLLHLLVCLRAGRAARTVRLFIAGGLAMLTGFAAVIVGAEALTYPLILLFRSQGLDYPHATFLELLLPRFISQTGVAFNPTGLALFPYFVNLFEGAAYVVCVALIGVAGIWCLCRHKGDTACALSRHRALVYLVVPFAVPFLIFSLKTMQGARTFMFALPFFCGIVAVCFVALWQSEWRRPRLARGVMAALLLTSIASSLAHVREVLAIRSAYPEVLRFVHENGAPPVCAAWSSVLESYLLQEHMEGGSLYRWIAQSKPLPRYYVSDWQELYDRRYPDEAVALPPGSAPAAAFDLRIGRIFLETEAFPSYGNTFENIRWVRALDLERARKVLVYDVTATGLREDLAFTPEAP